MKVYSLLLLSMLSIHSLCQTTWAPEDAEWYYTYSTAGSNPLANYEKFEIIKDSVVDEKFCQVIGSQFFSEIMYEEDGKVYYWFKDEFKLIYDFTANIGDTIEFELKSFSPNSFVIDTTYKTFCVVTKIESEIIDNIELKKFFTTVISNDSINHVLWPIYYNYQERIGFEYRFIKIISPPTTTDSQHTLRCYMDSDIQYSSDWWKLIEKPCDYKDLSSADQLKFDELNVFPNPATSKITVTNPYNSIIGTIKINDLSGRSLLQWNKLYHGDNVLQIESLISGIYLLKIESKTGIITKKIIVQKDTE